MYNRCNKSHSAAYAFLAYRTAWLSYYYPVEWNVACLTLDSMDGAGKEKIVTTLNSCKKRNIPVLPPDINKSKTGFTVDKLEDGTKAIRFGFVAIKDVGENISDMISELIKADGEFKSFDDFLNRTVNNKTNATLRNICASNEKYYSIQEDKKTGKMVKKLKNPFSKRNIVPLIFGGAFDSLEENRYKLFNYYITSKKDKDELKDENDFKLKDKLALELEWLGFYVSQHPLDGDAFPYIDLDLAKDNQLVKVAGILKGYDVSKTKKGDKFYKISIELKDGRIVRINVFKNTYTKHPECVKGLSSKKAKDGKEILIVEGRYSAQYNNINANKISKVRSSSDISDNTIPEVEEGIPDLKVKDNPLDNDLFTKVM